MTFVFNHFTATKAIKQKGLLNVGEYEKENKKKNTIKEKGQ